ncbi:MAG: 50S ribosomal protein L9 [SAR116 cluster bacterium]|nr:50S ribosomal protein L9 [SAR116 cluster bacterium]
MQIILLERVEKLGQLGDVVNVKPGYARNYLLPTGKALRANKANLEKFEAERADREARNADAKSAAESKAKAMDGLTVALVRAASEMGQLFGSVSSRDIADAVAAAGHELDKRQVNMDKSIKTLGLFPIRVSLHAEVDAIVTVNVARSLEEAETQAKTGQAVVARDDDEDKVEAETVAEVDESTDEAAEAAESAEADTQEDEAN